MIDDITFKANVAKLRNKRKHKLAKSYRNKDAWRWIKKHKLFKEDYPISEKLFGTIIKDVHAALINKLLAGGTITLPYGMGKIELVKKKAVFKYKNGKLITNLPVDWDKTLKFWEEDIKAFKQKKVIRQDTKWLYKIIYNKKGSNFKNKSFFSFYPNRQLKKDLSNKIKNNEVDTFILDYGRIR